MKEMGTIVGGRNDIEFVVVEKLEPLLAKQRLGGLIEIGLIQQIVAVGFLHGHSRIVGEIKGTRRTEIADGFDFGRRQHPVLDQQGAGVPAPDQRQPLLRLGDSRISPGP